jgi:hypothetical protein
LQGWFFETREGREEYSFFCSSQPEATAAGKSHWQGMEKHPTSKRLREQARRRREATPQFQATQQFQQQQQLAQQKQQKQLHVLDQQQLWQLSVAPDRIAADRMSVAALATTAVTSSHFRRYDNSSRYGDWNENRFESRCSNISSFNPVPHWSRPFWPYTSVNALYAEIAEGKVVLKISYSSSFILFLFWNHNLDYPGSNLAVIIFFYSIPQG